MMLYNNICIKESYTASQDSYGEQVKTWTPSTTIKGAKQGRTGAKSIVTDVEKLRVNERFYCNVTSIDEEDRLLFSTNVWVFQGTITASSGLTSTSNNALYFTNTAFSSYIAYSYIRNNGSTWVIEPFSYYKPIYVNNVRNHHLQIDLIEDNQGRV